MAKFVAKNLVKETTTTTGPSTYVLGGAVPGYDPFSVAAAGSKVAYKCEDAAGSIKEVGIGTVSLSPAQLTRDEILRSPSGSAVNWGPGTKTLTLVAPAELVKVTGIAPGPFDGRLEFVSATQVALKRYKGANRPLVSNGVWRDREIPSAGVTLGTGGLSASTEYNIYSSWSGSAIVLEASTTAHTADADTGVEIKSGDSTRVFEGRVKTSPTTQFENSDKARMVASWFHPRLLRIQSAVTQDRALTATTYTNINAADLNIEIMCLHGMVEVHGTGRAANTGGGNSTTSAISIDSVAQTKGASSATLTGAAPLACQHRDHALSEGAHGIQLFGRVSGGTGTWEFASGSFETGMSGWILG